MPGHDELLQRITVRRDVLGGRPCIRRSRVTVESVLDRLAQGVTPEAIVTEHPELELDDVFACAAYARTIVAGERLRVASTETAPARISLRELATRPPEEVARVVRAAGIVMDPDEIEAWDGTAGDGLDE